MDTVGREGVVVLGCPRSGTTLLRRLLDGHPAIAAPGETYLLTAASRFLSAERMVGGLEVGVVNGLGFLGYEETEVTTRLREFVFAFRREHAAREGKRRWLEKSAVDAFHIDEIHRLCGDQVHYICLIRHGLDVVVSMKDWVDKSEAYPAELHSFIRDEPRPMFAFARAWAASTTAVAEFAAARPSDAVVVRYEELAADPKAELARVLTFIGEDCAVLDIEAAMEEASKGFGDWKSFGRRHVDASPAGRWKSVLSNQTASDLAPLVNPTLAKLGYEVVGRVREASSFEKRRRYELGLGLQKLV